MHNESQFLHRCEKFWRIELQPTGARRIRIVSTHPTLFAAQTDVSSVTGTTPALTAGAYDLYVACHNLIDNCIFDETVTGFY